MKVAVDFDGTVLKTNSFPLWIKFSLKNALIEKRLGLFFCLTFLILFRKIIPVMKHSDFKKRINALGYPEDWPNRFCEGLFQKYHNSQIIKKIESYHSKSVVITTAAPCCYAKVIPNYFRFNGRKPHILCSFMHGKIFIDNYKVKKKENTLTFFEYAPFIFFTDHKDDLTLALRAQYTYLCNPGTQSLSAFQQAGIDFILLKDFHEGY